MENTKKIGIITFHRACNYGAVLQAYALQEAITKHFPEYLIEIVDYRCPAIEHRIKLFSMVHDGGIVKDVLRFIYQFAPKVKKFHEFSKFRNQYLKVSKKCDENSIICLRDTYQAVFAGSDQVWNLDITHFDKNYFLEFLGDETIKCSYAASFGFENIYLKYHNEILDLLKNFDYISLREEIGVSQLAAVLDQECRVCLDPTLLLKKDEWKSIYRMPAINEDYILLYCILETNSLIQFVRELSKKTGMKVFSISNHRAYKEFIQLKKLSVEEFLGWVNGAAFVATTSFHGTVFSIINHKSFVTEYNTKGNYNYRVQHLLQILNLEDREIDHERFVWNAEIDWKAVDKNLTKERQVVTHYWDEVKKRIEEDRDE